MNNRFLASLLCFLMILAMIPLGVVEAAGNGDVESRNSALDLTSTNGSYMSKTGHKDNVNFTTMSINDSAEGWSWDVDSKTLTLSGAQIEGSYPSTSSNDSAGIKLPKNTTVTIVLAADTCSKVQGGDSGRGGYAWSTGIESRDSNLIISGSGSLEVSGGLAAATGDFTAFSYGIIARSTVIGEYATVEATGGQATGTRSAYSAGIQDELHIKDHAFVTAIGGVVEAASDEGSTYYVDSHGIHTSDGTFEISGNAHLVAKGGNATDENGGDNSYSSGIRSKSIIVKDNAKVEAEGGTAIGGQGLSCGLLAIASGGNNKIVISGNAEVTAKGSEAETISRGIYAGSNYSIISISDNADVTATGGNQASGTSSSYFYSDGMYAETVNIYGGKVTAIGNNEALHTTSSSIKISPDTSLKMKIEVKAGDNQESASVINGSPFSAEHDITDLVKDKKYFHSEASTAIDVTPNTLDFGSVYPGYSQPMAKTVTIKNLKTTDVILNDTASSDSDFIISELSNITLETGSEATFTVQPKTNLATGIYTDTIKITGDNDAAAEIKLSFEVKRAEVLDANTENAKIVWYGEKDNQPLSWRIIGYALGGIAPSNGNITLFSSGEFGTSNFDNSSNEYGSSTLQTKAEEVLEFFSTTEKISISPRDLVTGAYKANAPYSDGIAGDPVPNAKLWPLSTAEADALTNAYIKNLSKLWWLRSPGEGSKSAYVSHGDTKPEGDLVSYSKHIRLAFHLKEDSIVLFSAAVGGKTSGSTGSDSLTKFAGTAAKELKLTIHDDSYDGFNISDIIFDGKQAFFSYTGATAYNADTAPSEYISALVKNETGEITYYGNVVQPDNVSGSAIINLPDDFDAATDRLYVFAEQANGDKLTDYAGELKKILMNAYPVAYDLINVTTDGLSYHLYGDGGADAYIATLTAASGYNLPGTITVKVGGSALEENDYSYSSTSGELSIPKAKITGPITITAIGSKISSGSSGGGSAGGAGTIVPPAPAEETVSISGGSEEVPLTVEVSGDTANVNPLGAAELQQILAAAGAAAESVALDLSAMDDLIDTVIIPGGLVTGVVQSAGPGLDITMPDGKGVSFDQAALDAILSAGSGDLKLQVRELDRDSLSDAQRALVGNSLVIDLTVFIGSTQVFDFSGGLVTISIPVVGQPVEYPIVWRMTTDEGGKVSLEAIECTYNSATKCYEFRTASFSIYVLGNYPFTDTPDSAWYYENAVFAYVNGLFAGTSETTFNPNVAMTRGMLVTVLWRMEGSPDLSESAGSSRASAFPDVASGKYYADAVAWASANEIVSGYGSGKFGPNDKISREQLAAILHRYAQYKGYDVSVGENTNILSYNDAFDIAEYAISALQWACGAGLVQGNNGSLMPQGDATRAQVAAILHRFAESNKK